MICHNKDCKHNSNNEDNRCIADDDHDAVIIYEDGTCGSMISKRLKQSTHNKPNTHLEVKEK